MSYKPSKRELPEALKKEIEEDPYYFVYQGGSDGTFGNNEYLGLYGEWQPEASAYAAELLIEQGLNW
jgi:hypothetical protein